MKDLLKNKWLMLLIGAVVLYFVWRKFGKGESMELNRNASGRTRPQRAKACVCQGRHLGWEPLHDDQGNVITCNQACNDSIRR